MLNRLVVVLLALSAATSASAQTGSIAAIAVSADDSTVIAHALVRLRAADTATRQQSITNAAGKVRFADLSDGDYRLQLLRIGYRPVTSEVLHVRAGEPLQFTLRAPTQAVQLAVTVVHPNATCLTAARLAEDPRVAELWNEARTGVETRRAFELAYQFRRELRQEVDVYWRLRGREHTVKSDTVVNEPDSVLMRDARRQAENRARGYAKGNLLTLPDEKEILDDAFLASHCIETTIAEADGAFGLAFRPLETRGDRTDVRGTIWIDSKNYQVRRMDVQYLNGNRAIADVGVAYADVVVDGAQFRLPSGGDAVLRPGGVGRLLASRVVGKFTNTYTNFRSRREPPSTNVAVSR